MCLYTLYTCLIHVSVNSYTDLLHTWTPIASHPLSRGMGLWADIIVRWGGGWWQLLPMRLSLIPQTAEGSHPSEYHVGVVSIKDICLFHLLPFLKTHFVPDDTTGDNCLTTISVFLFFLTLFLNFLDAKMCSHRGCNPSSFPIMAGWQGLPSCVITGTWGSSAERTATLGNASIKTPLVPASVVTAPATDTWWCVKEEPLFTREAKAGLDLV